MIDTTGRVVSDRKSRNRESLSDRSTPTSDSRGRAQEIPYSRYRASRYHAGFVNFRRAETAPRGSPAGKIGRTDLVRHREPTAANRPDRRKSREKTLFIPSASPPRPRNARFALDGGTTSDRRVSKENREPHRAPIALPGRTKRRFTIVRRDGARGVGEGKEPRAYVGQTAR